MNKLITTNTDEKTDEIDEILHDAENIILSSNGDAKKHIRNKALIIFAIIIAILAILLLAFSTVFALININSNKIMNGVFIQGIDVSGLTVNEAKEKVSNIVNKHLACQIVVKRNDFEGIFMPEQLGVTFDADSVVNKAYTVGRDGNIFENNYSILNCLLNNYNISTNINFDDEFLFSVISEINKLLPDKVIKPDYYIDDNNNLIITAGKDGVVVDEQEFKKELSKLLDDFDNDEPTLVAPVKNAAANKIDLDEIYKNIYKAPVDASYTVAPYVVYPSSNGVDFKISLDEAKEMLKTEQDEYTIPLKTLYPNVTTNQIGNEAFPDMLSSFSTSYTSSGYNRSTNIELAAKKLDGYVLMPGETASYNQIVGQRTKAAGFKEGAAYSNGKVVQEVGGGICQVSSTLYNAVVFANLEIVERYNHSYAVSYVPAGRDATVSYGGKDFKFKNNRKYPIKIVANAKNGVVNISLKGIKEDKEYDIEISSSVLSTTPFETTYQDNNTLAEGKQKIIQKGHNGYKSKAYKTVKYNGKVISKTLLSSDTYKPMNRIIEKGTKKSSSKSSDETTSKSDEKIEEAEVTENED